MLENVIDELPIALGISPLNKHGHTFHGRHIQIKQKITRLQDCLEVSIYTIGIYIALNRIKKILKLVSRGWSRNFQFYNE